MEVVNPDYVSSVEQVFDQAAFISDVGIRLVGVGPGWCESELSVLPRHYQHSHYIHAGVQATMCDHTAGAAATTLVGAGEYVLSAEFKINLLRPAQGERLRCRAQVLKAGRMLIVAEAEVFTAGKEQESMVAKATVTLAVVDKSRGPSTGP